MFATALLLLNHRTQGQKFGFIVKRLEKGTHSWRVPVLPISGMGLLSHRLN